MSMGVDTSSRPSGGVRWRKNVVEILVVSVDVHFLVLVLQGADKFCVLRSAQEVYHDWVCKSGG